jgi:alkaline phosphatase
MKLTHISIFSLIIVALTLGGCTKKKEIPKEKKVKNIILLIGDGMGLSQVSTTFYYNDSVSNFKRFKNIGFIQTSSGSHLITDSVAGATAFSTGEKTYNDAIGMNIDSIPQDNLVEIFSKLKMKTGLIATSSITHATPASFYAHAKLRSSAEEIATWMPRSELDYFAGGGLKYFNNRKDSIDYLEKLKNAGFTISLEGKDLKQEISNKNKYGFLLAQNGMPRMTDGRGDFLETATKQALSYLSKENEGFFLMIEGSQIDWGGHNNDAKYIIEEVKDFDKTIGEVLNFAKKNSGTLVIVTADHETGGFTLASGKEIKNGLEISDYNTIDPKFSTKEHSATLIPIFSYGPQSHNFQGIYENTEVFTKIVSALKN